MFPALEAGRGLERRGPDLGLCSAPAALVPEREATLPKARGAQEGRMGMLWVLVRFSLHPFSCQMFSGNLRN